MVVDDCLRHLDFVDLANRCRKSKGNTHEPVSFKVATVALVYYFTDLRTCRREWYPSRTCERRRVAPSRHRRVTDRDLCTFMTRISTQASTHSSFAAVLQLRSSINMARPRCASLISNFFFLESILVHLGYRILSISNLFLLTLHLRDTSCTTLGHRYRNSSETRVAHWPVSAKVPSRFKNVWCATREGRSNNPVWIRTSSSWTHQPCHRQWA